MFSFQMFFSNFSTYLFLMSATCYALPTLFYDDFDHLTLIENNQIESRIENDETPELFFKNKRQIGKYDPLFFANPANNYRAPAPNIPNFSSQGSSESATYNARPFKSIVIDHVIDHVIVEPPELSNKVVEVKSHHYHTFVSIFASEFQSKHQRQQKLQPKQSQNYEFLHL